MTYQTVQNTIKGIKPFFDLPQNQGSPMQKLFTVRKVLYDFHQRPQWPQKHVLSKNNSDELLKFITSLSSKKFNHQLVKESENWTKYKELLREFLEKHKIIEKNNGYQRILKKHLKNGNGFTFI